MKLCGLREPRSVRTKANRERALTGTLLQSKKTIVASKNSELSENTVRHEGSKRKREYISMCPFWLKPQVSSY